MVVRARSVVAVLSGFAALPLSAQVVKGINPIPPIFMCDGSVLNGINWGDGASFSAAPGIFVDKNPGPVGFSCSNNMYSAGLQGNNFAVNFGNFTPPDPSIKIDLKLDIYDYKVFTGGTETAPEFKFFSNFDMYINLYKLNTDGFAEFQYKEFVGLKLDSMFGFASGGDYKLMGDGSVMLDPSIPGGFGTLELYNTPAVPEPATLMLVGSGVAAGVLRRKRKPKA